MRFPDSTKRQSPWSRTGPVSRAVPISEDSLVRSGVLRPGLEMPCVFEATMSGVDLAAWASKNRDQLEQACLRHGAVLFRNFEVWDASDLSRIIEATSNGPLAYEERSSPRSTIQGRIYTSTDYPPTLDIFPHNEHSYSATFPLRLYFSCVAPATQGGETPIADTRAILRRISASTRQKFAERGWMYVRNFGDGFGLSWQESFQSEDRAVVETYCDAHGIEWEWRGNRLRTRQIRPTLAKHPQTGELIWFNHATFFHVSTLDAALRNGLLATFDTADLPNNTYYGDGTEIEDGVMQELRASYLSECIEFPWQRGDVLMIDNMLTAHARKAYQGTRKILVGMANPHTRTDM